MAVEHEYSVIGHSRSVVGRYLGTVAGALAAAAGLGAAAFFEWFSAAGFSDRVPDIVLWPLTAGAIFALVHVAFDKLVWRWAIVQRFLKIPDLNGTWVVEGETLNPVDGAPANWTGEIRISQSWEKIWVHLKTAQSSSRSKAAALLYEPGGGFCLMYSYRNEPKIGEPISPHVGYSELTFDDALTEATGEYFNSKGRVTFGRMTLRRKT